MNLLDLAPIGVALALLATGLVHRELMRAAQALRLCMAEKGEMLLKSEELPSSARKEVEAILEDVFPCNCLFLVLMLFILPVLVWSWVWKPEQPQQRPRLNAELRGELYELRALHRRVQLANHPVLTPLFELVITIALVIAVPVLVAFRRSPSPSLDRDDAFRLLEHQNWKFAPIRRSAGLP